MLLKPNNLFQATIKRTTGLPIDELVETTPDDPGAMLHPSGKYMVQKMHRDARLNSKAKAPILPFMRDLDSKPVGSEDENVSFLENKH